jgi:pimeloyl-ACP methyl ester carboxylesterase
VALEAATLRPDLVAGVVLLDGTVLFPDVIRSQALSTLVPALEGERWLEALQGYFGRFFGSYDSPSLKSRVMQDITSARRDIAAPLFRDIMSWDFAAQLASGQYPLMFIHARVPADLARLRQLRPDALVGSVVGSGHYLMLQVPDQVNAMLDRFLQIVASKGNGAVG